MEENTQVDIERVQMWLDSPIPWVEDMFGLVPQPLREGFVVGENTKLSDIDVRWFKDFERGKHITWQQWVILLAVERAVQDKAKRFISVASGRGVGKSCTMAWVLIWFLMCHKESQVPCTAPTSQQMYDVLWKEVAKWHQKMPFRYRELFEVESSYIRVKERPRTWFARAATARKEKPEALAGIHADDVAMLVDEASAVCDEVFITGEGTLTNENALLLMISNHTRLAGYFHESQKNAYGEFQTMQFNSEDSPVVDKVFIERMGRKGLDSDEYRVHVKGLPPNAAEEFKGYYPLIRKDDLRFSLMDELVQPIVLGIDPSGEGKNRTSFVLRDPFRAVQAGSYDNLKASEIAQKAVELQSKFKVLPDNTMLDAFGVGAETMNEFMAMRRYVQGVLVGNKPNDKTRFMNLKAELYWRMREWISKGGELSGTADQWGDIVNIMYTSENSKVKIMSKRMMIEAGYQSPDEIESLMLTFFREHYEIPLENGEEQEERFDPYQCL